MENTPLPLWTSLSPLGLAPLDQNTDVLEFTSFPELFVHNLHFGSLSLQFVSLAGRRPLAEAATPEAFVSFPTLVLHSNSASFQSVTGAAFDGLGGSPDDDATATGALLNGP